MVAVIFIASKDLQSQILQKLVIARSMSRLRSGTNSQFRFMLCPAEFFNQVEQCRDNEDCDRTRSGHSSHNCCAHDLTRYGTGTACPPERDAPQNECERGH